MLVLLIIFMVTAPLMQQGLEIDLPETKASGVEATDEPFILTINKNQRVFIGEVRVPMSELGNKLEGIFATRKNKQVYIRADKATPYGAVAEVAETGLPEFLI
ncbi:MAG: biopolymer transporter ExbD [Bdellovibrionales bacterium]